jgi:hypothetical protein
VEIQHFGTYLKQRREAQGRSLAEVSRATKIKEHSLLLLEAGSLIELPALVFVRGFVAAYAREVGADPSEAMRLLSERVEAERQASGGGALESAEGSSAGLDGPGAPSAAAGRSTSAAGAQPQPLAVKSIVDVMRRMQEAGGAPVAAGGGRVNVVMLVLLVLVVATLTLSFLLREGAGGMPGIS